MCDCVLAATQTRTRAATATATQDAVANWLRMATKAGRFSSSREKCWQTSIRRASPQTPHARSRAHFEARSCWTALRIPMTQSRRCRVGRRTICWPRMSIPTTAVMSRWPPGPVHLRRGRRPTRRRPRRAPPRPGQLAATRGHQLRRRLLRSGRPPPQLVPRLRLRPSKTGRVRRVRS